MTIDLDPAPVAPPAPAGAVRPAPAPDVASVVADLRRAADVVAPLWPLTSVVAVNPLGGLEHLGFDRATAVAAHWTRGRTRLGLDELRAAHGDGRVGDADLDAAVRLARPDLARSAPVVVDGRRLDVVGLVRRDLLVGPSPAPTPAMPRCAGERWDAACGTDLAGAVDEVVTAWAARVCGHGGDGRLLAGWRRLGLRQRGLRALVDDEGRRWLAGLPEAPGEVLAVALASLGIAPDQRTDELRGQLVRVRGWAGYARWSGEWAGSTDPGPRLALVELAALRTSLEAAALATAQRAAGGVPVPGPGPVPTRPADQLLDERAAAVAAELGATVDIDVIAGVLARVSCDERDGLAQTALERAVADRLLGVVDGRVPGPALPPVLPGTRATRAVAEPRRTDDAAAGARVPAAQVVCCIDVRSEPLRRSLERTGPYETLGFAGFFGVAVAVRGLDWPAAEARCPVLVRPAHEVVAEVRPGQEVAAEHRLRRGALRGAADGALEAAHHGAASPFALAEAAGWLDGPRAAWQTLVPHRRRRRPAADPSRLVVARPDDGAATGLSLEERVATAAAVLRTMGLTDGFAPLVVLCGHRSHSRNNPHATSLECGACGGASGAESARVAAALLDDPAVRRGLADEGIDVPDSTWFVPAVHDTVTDEVELLDVGDVPDDHREALVRLERDLAAAGAAAAAGRAVGLPGRTPVADRGADPAQVRPEWGLAGNAAIIVGPRSLTAGVDLGARSFLHTYDADADPDGEVLTTILTAPVVVAHWISSQYLFSSLDPEAFGAGDKLLHNPVGGVGVVTGPGGDLRVGLPEQSVTVGDQRVHEPLRLLAVVDAPRERVDAIVAHQEVLQTLLDGSWLHLVARGEGGAWWWRTPDGGWADLDGIPVASTPAGEG